jgi:hypothetical protein
MHAEQMALMIPIVALCIPLMAIWVKHRERLAEIQSRVAPTIQIDESLKLEMDELKRQLVQLRDTTTKFDMSFDTQLDQLEQRVQRVETRSYTTANDESASVNLGQR